MFIKSCYSSPWELGCNSSHVRWSMLTLPPPNPRAMEEGKISISGRETFEMRLFMHEGVSINSRCTFIWWLFSGDWNAECYFSIKLNMEATGLCMPGWPVRLASLHTCFIFKSDVSAWVSPVCLASLLKKIWLTGNHFPPALGPGWQAGTAMLPTVMCCAVLDLHWGHHHGDTVRKASRRGPQSERAKNEEIDVLVEKKLRLQHTWGLSSNAQREGWRW